jgi:hypothetical protein
MAILVENGRKPSVLRGRFFATETNEIAEIAMPTKRRKLQTGISAIRGLQTRLCAR